MIYLSSHLFHKLLQNYYILTSFVSLIQYNQMLETTYCWIKTIDIKQDNVYNKDIDKGV